MDIEKWLASTVKSNVSPTTYIIFVMMLFRGIILSFNIIENNLVSNFWAFPTIALAIGAQLAIIGFAREWRRFVAVGAFTAALAELYAVIIWINYGDLIQALTISLPLFLASAYVYLTNSMGTLWSYTPRPVDKEEKCQTGSKVH